MGAASPTRTDRRRPHGRRRRAWAPWLTGVVLAVLVAGVYSRVPEGDFHFDDLLNISQNAAVRMDEYSTEALVRAATESPLERRGLAYASFAVDWYRGGGAARTFLWTNLTLHVAVAVLVYALLLVTLRGKLDEVDARTTTAAFFGTAIWAVHPIQVQAVAYVVQRMAQMACLFTVLAVLAYILARRSRGRAARWMLLGLSAVSMLAGALSKENAYIAPVLLVLTELGILRRDRPLFRSGLERAVIAGAGLLAGLTVGLGLVGVGPLVRYLDYSIRDFTMLERALTQPRVLLFHVGQVFWPLPDRFGLEHDFAVSTSLLDPPATLLALLVIGAWCVAGVLLLSRRGQRHLGFWMLWPPATLAIESSIVPLEMIFEHRMYLPTIGLVALGVTLVVRWARRPRRAALALVFAALVVGLLSASAVARVAVWRTPLRLAQDAVRNAPNSSRARSGLGLAHLRDGAVDLAERDFRQALELNAENPWALEYLGVILMDRGELEEARATLAEALALRPRRPTLANHYGEVLLKLGRYAEAERFFDRALTLRPWVPAYHWNRALALEALDRCREARAEWEQYLALETDPGELETARRHLRQRHETPGAACHADSDQG